MSAAAPATEGRRELWPNLREWGLVVALALLPALPLLVGGGLVNTRAGGDSPFLLVRVHQLVANLRAGVFPARWMPEAAYGLGYPFFNFYASLPYYLAATFRLAGLGYIASIQLTQILGFLFAALAVYGFGQELHKGAGASLLIAVAYSCTPFHMVNVYVRGDSLSEFYAFVFFPLILWALLRLQKQPSVRNIAWAAFAYAGLIATHQISAMIFSPFMLLYVVCLAWESRGVLLHAIRSLFAVGAGLLASAWFWLPALAESRNVYLQDMTTGYFNYAQHFRRGDLIQRSLAFDYAITA
ncbi:MAG: hypothetical protein FJ026_13230, partial [Chloroflexi bacterium]|nr:hypothetical protein [Chloroflexota bacterium]